MSTSTVCFPATLRLFSEDDPFIPLRAAHERGWPKPHTLRKYVHAGRLPAVRAGKQFLVKESDLARLMSPANAAVGAQSDAQTPTKIDLTELAEAASRVVASWPRLSEQRRTELGRILAPG